jgi:hypothetical protein
VDRPQHHGRQHRPHQKALFDRIPFWVGGDARDLLHLLPRIAKVGGMSRLLTAQPMLGSMARRSVLNVCYWDQRR